MHDYTFRYAEFMLKNGGYTTIDMHKVTAVVGDTVVMDNGFQIELVTSNAFDLSVILLSMDKNFNKAY